MKYSEIEKSDIDFQNLPESSMAAFDIIRMLESRSGFSEWWRDIHSDIRDDIFDDIKAIIDQTM